jgi:hypothetical protein
MNAVGFEFDKVYQLSLPKIVSKRCSILEEKYHREFYALNNVSFQSAK